MAELIGYLGSLLVAASLMMSNIWKLRWVNLFGALFFVVYGLLVGAYPVAAVNAFIVAIDAYYLVRMARKRDFFSLMPIRDVNETFLRGFLDFHSADIQGFFPGFDIKALDDPNCVFLLRNMLPVGLFVYKPEGEKAVRIHLDYVVPEYRDHKNARYLYDSQAGNFWNQGFRTFRIKAGSGQVGDYLRKMGFSPSEEDPGSLEKPIGLGTSQLL